MLALIYVAGVIVGAVLAWWLFPRTVWVRPEVIEAGSGVSPHRGWSQEHLLDRHIRHAAKALTNRELSTEAAIEDALASAERFIAAARREIARQKHPEQGDVVPLG